MKSKAAEIYFSILAEIACGASNEDILKDKLAHRASDIDSIRNAPAYKQENPNIARRLCLLGLNNASIGEYFEIPVYVFNCWRNAYPSFNKAIANGRENADCAVAEALLSLCIGYEHPEQKVFKGKDDDIITHECIKHYPPNISAIKLWLEARRSGIWKNPELIEMGLNLTIESKDMSKEDLDAALHKAGLFQKDSKLSSLSEIPDADFEDVEE